MNKQEVIERLNNKLDEVFAFQRSFKPLTGAHMECESKANAYMTAINYVEQLDEPQKVKVPAYVEEHIEYSDSANWSLLESIQEMNGNVGSRELANWFEAHSEDYARAWLDGYEVEESKWAVKEGDLVIRKGCHEAKVYFVESVDDDGILLVNGIKDEFFTDGPERAADDETLSYFYENFRLLAKKENLEVEQVEV